ncbi:hypothetical protein E143388_06123 [Rhodococcus opacus]|nr:hypothetical protein E143388_06123 [Rhodococcus opacus]
MCSGCFLAHHRSRLAVSTGGMKFCGTALPEPARCRIVAGAPRNVCTVRGASGRGLRRCPAASPGGRFDVDETVDVNRPQQGNALGGGEGAVRARGAGWRRWVVNGQIHSHDTDMAPWRPASQSKYVLLQRTRGRMPSQLSGASRRSAWRVGGHEKLPIGGHESARQRPRNCPPRPRNCPVERLSCTTRLIFAPIASADRGPSLGSLDGASPGQ